MEHWPRLAPTEEIVYYEFIDKITDSKQEKFYPKRDGERRPIPKSGAMKVTTDLIRLKTEEGEFLLSKSYIIGHDAAGEEVSFYLPFSERWFKTLFAWTNEYKSSSKQFDRICLGPNGTQIQYLLEFNKDNAKDLFD